MTVRVKADRSGGAGRKNSGDQARTRLARRAVVDAARSLFLERGYQATTIAAISERSDVPTPTVYRLFASKLGILKTLLDVSIAGDDQAVAVPDRPEVAAALATPEPAQLVARFVGIAVAINARSNEIHEILASAASADPGAATLLAEYRRQRNRGQGGIAGALARAGALRPGLDERNASDLVHAFMSPELYRLLVTERRWSPERYERWLAATLTDQLVASGPSAARTTAETAARS